MTILCSGNPFISAYLQSDGFGKGVFWVLISLSVVSWIVLLQKLWMYICVKRSTAEFSKLFSEKDPLGLQFPRPIRGSLLKLPHPLFDVYRAFKTKALAITYRGHFFTGNKMFSSDDLDLLSSELEVAVSLQVKKFEKHLFVLSTAARGCSQGYRLLWLQLFWGWLLRSRRLSATTILKMLCANFAATWAILLTFF
jgi:biopolymer transport protein ExbB/TolQ